MSFLSSFFLGVFLLAIANAGELPWIGVSLGQAKSEDRKNTPLGEGIGLRVTKVEADGPLSKAGGEEGDLWWKFDGQILVNKRQMFVLLRSKSPGDKILVEYFRAGVLESLSLVLEAKTSQQTYLVSQRPPGPDTSRILAKREQVARLDADDQTLTLQREGEGWRFQILKDGNAVLSSVVFQSDLNDKIPSKWHESFLILRLTLEQQVKSSAVASETRVRYLPREKSSENSN